MSNDQRVIQLLEQVSAKLDNLENRISKIENQVQTEVFNTFSIAVDSFDDYCGSTDNRRREMSSKAQSVADMVQTLTSNNTLETIEMMLEKAPQLAQAVEQLEALPQIVSVATDSFDELFRYAQKNGLNIAEFGNNFSAFAVKLLTLFEEGNLNKLLDSGILDGQAIDTVGAMGKSLSTSTGEVKKVGALGMLTAIFNSDVQRAAGFLIGFAQTFGKNLDNKKLN